jgi:hypothetical protein
MAPSSQPLAGFMTNPAGAAIVNAVGPVLQLVSNAVVADRRHLVIVPEQPTKMGAPVQIQWP